MNFDVLSMNSDVLSMNCDVLSMNSITLKTSFQTAYAMTTHARVLTKALQVVIHEEVEDIVGETAVTS